MIEKDYYERYNYYHHTQDCDRIFIEEMDGEIERTDYITLFKSVSRDIFERNIDIKWNYLNQKNCNFQFQFQ